MGLFMYLMTDVYSWYYVMFNSSFDSLYLGEQFVRGGMSRYVGNEKSLIGDKRNLVGDELGFVTNLCTKQA